MGFEPATYGFQIRRSNHSATLPFSRYFSLIPTLFGPFLPPPYSVPPPSQQITILEKILASDPKGEADIISVLTKSCKVYRFTVLMVWWWSVHFDSTDAFWEVVFFLLFSTAAYVNHTLAKKAGNSFCRLEAAARAEVTWLTSSCTRWVFSTSTPDRIETSLSKFYGTTSKVVIHVY